GLVTYRCTRPLGESPPHQRGWGPLRHDYICVMLGNHMYCNSQTAANETVGNYVRGPGAPTNDTRTGEGPDQYNIWRCDRARDDDPCLESCLVGRLMSQERPTYGIGPQGTDCQEWVQDT